MPRWLPGLQLALIVTRSASAGAINAQNATAFALTYGYPLLVFEGHVQNFNTPGPNEFKHVRFTCNPTLCPKTIRPDIDTLYSQMVWDLSNNDVAIGLPRGVPQGQFVLFSFFDPYGDNFANLGSEHIHTTGEYLLRRSARGAFGVTQCAGQREYQACVDAPSTYGYLIARWLVNDTNIDQVREWQKQTTVRNITHPRDAPDLYSLPKVDSSEDVVLNVLNLLAKFAQFTTPTNASDAKHVDEILAAAGITKRGFVQQPGVDLHKANETALAAAAEAGSSYSSKEKLSNGWSAVNPALQGRFQSDYALRESIAVDGDYLALTAPNRLYASWSNSSSKSGGAQPAGDLVLGEDESIIYSFSSKPPLEATGFWSLTAYSNNTLIPNSEHVYHISSVVSNITDDQGNVIYGPNSTCQDRSFQILVQADNMPPPRNWTANWLPGPSGGGNISVAFRLYDPGQTVFSGVWSFPTVTKQAAITH